jgi:zinc protease
VTPSLSDFVVRPIRTEGLQPSRRVLDNRVTVIAKETRKTPVVTLSLALRAGTICDPPAYPGATFLLAKTIDRGTATKSAAEIAEALEDRGASLEVTVTRHLLSLSCTCLAEDFETVLSLIADVVMAAAFPEAELALQKREVVTYIQQDADNPAVRAVEGLMALLYGADHPYGRPAKGSIGSVERMPREQLLALHGTRFAPSELAIVIVGAVETAKAFDAAAAAFGGWRRPVPPAVNLPGVVAPRVRRRIVLPMMNKSQVDIAYGFTTIARTHPHYFAFWLLNVVLGTYAMGGRLGESIRERQGMAYYALSTFDPNVLPGPLVVRAGVHATNVERTIRSIDEELRALSKDGITDRELAEARQYMIGAMPRTLETSAGIAQFLQTCEFFGLGLDYDVRLPDLLGAVTRNQVLDLARRYLDPERASIVIAGPYDDELGSERSGRLLDP